MSHTPLHPDADKVAQIRRLTERIQRDFGVTPTGMWIAERVWEPGLPRMLREANMTGPSSMMYTSRMWPEIATSTAISDRGSEQRLKSVCNE